ncbi:MAG: ABC transporter permease, partial [Longimicrobiales bacterium]
TLGRGAASERIQVGVVTWDYFPLTGVSAQRGRFFNEVEDRPFASEPVVVLSHELWQRRFQGAADIIGRTVELSAQQFTVIGVAPRNYTGVSLLPVDLWAPMSVFTRVRDDWPTTWRAQWMTVVARLKPGVSAEAAGADATRVLRAVYPADLTNWKTAVLSLRPLRYSSTGKEPTELIVARWLIGVSAIVLLIACANVANLLLARALRRRREIAVRVVLGISRWRLIRLMLTESFVLAGMGAVAGLAVAYWGGHFMRLLLLPNVHWSEPPVHARVLGFSALAALLTGLLIGFIPVLQAALADMSMALKTGVREGGGRRSRVRGALTTAQCALSVVLLVGAGLFVRSLWNVHHLDLGLEPDRVLHVDGIWPTPVSAPAQAPGTARVRTTDELEAWRIYSNSFWDRALEQVRAMPAVASASTAVGTPFNTSFGIYLRVPGRDSIPSMPGGGPYVAAIQAGFLETLGIDLLRGRYFGAHDRAGSERVAIVNTVMANTLWPNQDAIGQCLIIGADSIPCARIVGVVEEAR